MASVGVTKKKKTLLGYELSVHQDALVNYLVTSIGACILYSFLIAFDIAVIFYHYKNEDPIWASLSLFFMYFPALGSFIIIVSNWVLWPEFEGCGRENTKWFCMKVVEHLFFPAWSMWRFAEKIFWSIEAYRAKNEQLATEALEIIDSPRSIELYVFLQSYTHSLPQVLLQLYILMRHNASIDRQTENAQILSVLLNLARISMTTTYYQRFRSQKLTGKQYPWYKHYKATTQSQVVLRRQFSEFSESRNVVEDRRNTSNLEDNYDLAPPRYTERRRSSDIYLEPSTSVQRHTLLVTDFDEEIQTNVKTLEGRDEIDRPNLLSGPPHLEQILNRGISERTEPDFNISRVIEVKGLAEDDFAGKLVGFIWWYAFLLARVLAISVFAYFFLSEAIWLLSSHFILVIALLSYDVKSDAVKRAKAVFFVFIGLIYIFCIIEFKIKFKKATFIYYGFFFLVFAENIVMCLIWYVGKVESIENDYWFRYIFYAIIICSLLSFSSMVFYFIVNKPPKVVVETRLSKTY